jgi:hypothetical protein
MNRDVGAIASEARGRLLERTEAAIERHMSDPAAASALREELYGAVVAAFATIFSAVNGGHEDGSPEEEAVVF